MRVHLLAADAQNPSGTCASTLWDTGHLAGQNIRPSETARYDITTVSVRNPQDFFARRSGGISGARGPSLPRCHDRKEAIREGLVAAQHELTQVLERVGPDDWSRIGPNEC